MSTYETRIAKELHPKYFQQQNMKRWSTKIIRNKLAYSSNVSINFSYTIGDGAVDFQELGYSISGAHQFYNLIHLNWDYAFNRKTISNLDINLNTSFRVRLLYTI